MSPLYGVLVPVKPPARAKSRLAELGDAVRRELSEAFAYDTVAAVTQCPHVSLAVVVTDDASLARGLADLGVTVMPDGVGDDLNGSLRLAAVEVHRQDPSLRVAAVFADLPALKPTELSLALEAAPPDRLAFVADAHAIGTTAVLAPTLATFVPLFGEGSRAAHLAAGAHEIMVDAPGLRHDVDTPSDLAVALRLGVGARTSFVATKHRL